MIGLANALIPKTIRGFTILALLLTLGCVGREADRDAVEALLKQRRQALTRKENTLYLSLISRDYQDKGEDYAAKTAALQKTLASFDSIEYRVTDVQIDIRGQSATVTCNYGLKVTRGGKSLKLGGKEELKLRKEAGGWKIVAGL